jgi:hypothetical protein
VLCRGVGTVATLDARRRRDSTIVVIAESTMTIKP